MIELDQKVWDDLVSKLANRLGMGFTLNHAMHMFIDDYWSILDSLASEALKEDDEEVEELDIDDYFERKIKPMWDYVYNLQKRVNSLESRSTQKYGLSTDSKVYPNWNIPQTMCDANGAVGSAGDGGSAGAGANGGSFATSGYMQLTDKKYTPKYTPEQIKEWSELRFDYTSAGR